VALIRETTSEGSVSEKILGIEGVRPQEKMIKEKRKSLAGKIRHGKEKIRKSWRFSVKKAPAPQPLRKKDCFF